MSPSNSRNLPPVYLLFLAGAIGFILISNVVSVLDAKHALTWKQAEARVISHSMTEEREPFIRETRPERRMIYYANFEYEFIIDGQTYRSSQRSLDNCHPCFWGYSKEDANRKMIDGGCDIGETIPIYYNPKDPSQAVTNRAILSGYYITIGGLAAMIVGLVALYWKWRHKRTMFGDD